MQSWQNPWHSLAAMAGVILFCFLPRLVVPALLAWLVQSTLAAQPENAGGWVGGWHNWRGRHPAVFQVAGLGLPRPASSANQAAS